MIGVINLDKPVGPTSHDMVGLVRRLTDTRRIGHAGTLDPLASGVLPILVGQATRFSEDLTGGSKRYDATVRLGWRSATDDGEGPLTAGEGPLPDADRLPDAFAGFVGRIEQRPPAYSARKRDGMRAHRAARAGTPLELPPRTVRIDGIEVVGVSGASDGIDVDLDVRCGAGTYIRSLARDVGELLGCGGYLRALRRTEAAGLAVADAVTPDALAALAAAGRLVDAILPVTGLLPLPRVELDAAAAARFRNGSIVRVVGSTGGRHVVLHDDALLGVGSIVGGQLQPEKVLAETGA